MTLKGATCEYGEVGVVQMTELIAVATMRLSRTRSG